MLSLMCMGPPAPWPPPRLNRREKIGAIALDAIGHDVAEGQYPFLPDTLQHRRRQWGLRLKPPLVGHLALPPSCRIRRAKPDVRQKKPLIDERIPLARGLPGQDAHLTILHFPQRPTILPRHACGVVALFDKARFIEHEDAIGLAQLLRYELMRVPPPLLLIPHRLTQKTLQTAETAPLDRKGHRFNRFPGQGAVLPHHVIQEMPAGFTPRKTIVADTLALL